jgi:hypothetical protein
MSDANRKPLQAWIDGIGFIAPGMPDWASAAAVLRGELPYASAPSVLPVPTLLPSAERRRASRVIKLSLGLGFEAVAHAGADAATLATVFSASGADGHNGHLLCEQLASDDRQISPTRFHNSVHNVAAGYWGIATRCMAPCQVVAAFDVACTGEPVLLVSYDSEYPEPLFAKRNTPDCAGVALVLSPQQSDVSKSRIQLTTSRAPAQAMGDAGLEFLRLNVPALRALPLLERMARGEAGAVVLDYLAPMQLELDVHPC